MNTSTTIIIIIFGMIIAIPITRVLVNQIGNFISSKKKPYLYLVFAILPLWELWKFFNSAENFFCIPFFYFWIIYLTAILILFFLELRNGNKTENLKGENCDANSSDN